MKYFEVEFTLEPYTQDACDLLSALAGEAGFETFEERGNGLTGYVQQQQFDQQMLDSVIGSFPLEGTHISYQVREAEDRDWNEQWEQEGFEPICISLPNSKGKISLVIHDGRHFGDISLDKIPHKIEIDAHMAFGTGTHETTRMICQTLLETDVRNWNVLDCGCGTGILGICALKLGAYNCTAYDIDEWSVENSRHNAVINRVEDSMTILHGDASLFKSLRRTFELVMANINRNILLQDMEHFVNVLRTGGTLILSGFYKSDCALLESKAQTLGLTHTRTLTDGEWACMVFKLKKHS